MRIFTTLVFCLVTSLAANASAIATGNALPALTVSSKGEVRLADGKFSWQPWTSTNLNGQVYVIQYLAARQSTSTMNEQFADALTARAFPGDKYAYITLVNMDDAMWGTSGFVPGKLEETKKQHPDHVLVADAKGDGRKTWDLNKESSAIIVLDKAGKVVFFKDGALTKDEIDSTLKLIESLL
jgi:uncharacterized protein